ncbi:MAG: hypothetical protein CFH02_00870, partial [Alphaproteobacteria bacterium MarineAlpha3_Bin1]
MPAKHEITNDDIMARDDYIAVRPVLGHFDPVSDADHVVAGH